MNGNGWHRGVLDTNFYGVHKCIEAFLPILAPHASLITVSSEVGSYATYGCSDELQKQLLNIDDLSFDKLDKLAQAWLNPPAGAPVWPEAPATASIAYGASKALVTSYMRRVAIYHPEYTATIVCPGYCATDLNRFSGIRSTTQGGESTIYPVTHKVQSTDRTVLPGWKGQ